MTAIDYAALVERLRKDHDDGSTESMPDAIAAIERLTQPGGEVEPVAYVVFDEDGPGFCAGWESACHEHINDAINEHDCVEAAKWKVVAVSPTTELSRLIAERDKARDDVTEWKAKFARLETLQDEILAELNKEQELNNTLIAERDAAKEELAECTDARLEYQRCYEFVRSQRESLKAQAHVLKTALEEAASVFGRYAMLHGAKTPPDSAKANANLELARMCDKALAATEPKETTK